MIHLAGFAFPCPAALDRFELIDMVLREATRQVQAQCAERGHLLTKLRGRYVEFFSVLAGYVVAVAATLVLGTTSHPRERKRSPARLCMFPSPRFAYKLQQAYMEEQGSLVDVRQKLVDKARECEALEGDAASQRMGPPPPPPRLCG